MSSILTNVAAMTALQNLTMTQQELQQTTNEISTGKKISQASDNAAYWSISTTMNSDNAALSSVSNDLSLGASTVSVATSGLNSAISIIQDIKTQLVSAQEPGVNRTQIQSAITADQQQLQSIATAASFSGQNWLSVDSSSASYSATKNIVASFSRDSSGNVSTGTIGVDTSGISLFDANSTPTGILDKSRTVGSTTLANGIAGIDISSLTDSAADQATLANYVSATDAALTDVTNAESTLGSVTNRITLQQTFISNLSNSITQGVGSLVDADMNQASTRLQALQTQQQLGIQSLSIANQNSQMILKLFGG